MSSQPTEPGPNGLTQRHTTLMAFVLVGFAITGYFLGLTSPMTGNGPMTANDKPSSASLAGNQRPTLTASVIPATAYLEMGEVEKNPGRQPAIFLSDKGQKSIDPQTTILVNDDEKAISLADRETRRAYNGAPPTVPHSIDQLDSAACMACHGEGLQTTSFRASKMPHPFFTNCTQCHVEQRANYGAPSATFVNSFTGASAPMRGARAYAGAPPVVPHSTWMRNDCLSCHGPTAAPGMASTHPWRKNCLQCHAVSSQLNQTKLDPTLHFLPALENLRSYE